MNTRRLTRHSFFLWLAACAVFPLLFACQLANVSTGLPPEQTLAATQPVAAPTATTVTAALPTAAIPVPTAQAATAVQAAQPPSSAPGEITLDLSGVAQDQLVETVEALPDSAEEPFWEAAPQYVRVTLQGYPVAAHLMQPQIFIYPAADLALANENAGKIASDLQALLQTRQAGERLPYLPQYNAAQVLHAQVQYLDFKNGKGVRYLTQFDQAPLPVNNFELIYTFQGLTSDGKYYIAAVLPVTHPDLPANQQVSAQQIAEMNDFSAYLAKTVTWLDQQPGASFTPDLAKLDALIQSIEVK
jgi:hypothetical protein